MDELPPRLPAPRRPVERLRDWVTWFGPGRLVAIGASVVLIGAGGYWLVAPPPEPVEASLPRAGAPATGSNPSEPLASGEPNATESAATEPAGPVPVETATAEGLSTVPVDLVVHVAGAVVAPGLHRVPPGARVADAVAAAGGAALDAHTDAVNLAAPLRDGDRVYVPRLGDGVTVPVGVSASPVADDGTRTPATSAPPGPVALNTASADQLDSLPGVGPATAAAIVSHRDQHGPFRSVDGLADVRGIGPAKLEQLRPLVTL